jgi:hypothetical protein
MPFEYEPEAQPSVHSSQQKKEKDRAGVPSRPLPTVQFGWGERIYDSMGRLRNFGHRRAPGAVDEETDL